MSNVNLYEGFQGNANELAQQIMSNPNFYDASTLDSVSDSEKFNYYFTNLLRTMAKTLIKTPRIPNYLAEFERGGTLGGFIRSLGFDYVRPVDPPTFAQYSDPGNALIFKQDIDVTYHYKTLRSELARTLPTMQIRDAVNNVEEIGEFIAGIMDAFESGGNAMLFWTFREMFYDYWAKLPVADQTRLSVTGALPATINNRDDAITALNVIGSYIDEFQFMNTWNGRNFTHVVTPDRIRVFVEKGYARSIVNNLTLTHFLTKTDGADALRYGSSALNLAGFLNVPCKILDNFGGRKALDSAGNVIYPKMDSQGGVTGTFSSTPGGTDTVAVASWGFPANEAYTPKVVIAEDDFLSVFTVADSVNNEMHARGGGYNNIFRYMEKHLVTVPQANSVYLM